MTTLNFPSDPSLNQTYEAGTKKWIWNGAYWKAISPTERIGYTGSVGYDGSQGYTGSIGFVGSRGYGSINFLTRNYTGNSTSTTFTITTGLGADSVFVFENGIMQFPTTDYSITGTNLIFATAPATDVAIQIRELIIDSGGTGFTGSKGDAGGYTGSRGDIGFTGSKGDAGGYTGSAGTNGYTGSAGFTGSIGNIGYTGSGSSNARAMGYSLIFGG